MFRTGDKRKKEERVWGLANHHTEPIHMLIEHEGHLVEIGEVDWAEDEIVLDSTCGSPVRDFLGEEEEQAQEARWNNELTFHAEVEAV